MYHDALRSKSGEIMRQLLSFIVVPRKSTTRMKFNAAYVD
jgi:hypothetical protein